MRKNFLRIASGAFAAQALIVVSTPILTRLFEPDAFGILAAFSSVYAIIIPFTTLKYDSAIVLPKSNDSAIQITLLVILVASAVVLGITALVLLFTLLGPLNILTPSILFITPVLWLGAMFTITQQWGSRKNDFRIFAQSQVFGSAVNIFTCITFGLTGHGTQLGLVLGFVFGMFGALLYSCANMGLIRRVKFVDLKSLIRKTNVRKRLRRYISFPVYVLPTVVFLALAQSSMTLVLTAFYPANEVGYYAIANRLLVLPAALLGSALFESFRSEMNLRYRTNQQLTQLFNSTMFTLLILAVITFGSLVATAPILFPFVFGPSFENSAHIVFAASLGSAAQFVGNPISSLFVSLRRTELGLAVQMSTTLVPLIVVFFGATASLSMEDVLFLHSALAVASTFIVFLVLKGLCNSADAENTK